MKPKKLHKTAPLLSEISLKENPFNIPENYFETIEDGVLAELYAEKLEKTFTKNNFKTPTNYFENEDELLIKLPTEKSTSKVFSKKVIQLITSISIAASIGLFFYFQNTQNETVTIDSIATSDIEQSINAGLIDINQVTLAQAFPDIDLSTNDNTLSISDSELQEYLHGENIETIIYEN